MKNPTTIESKTFPFKFDIGTDENIIGEVTVLEYQDSGLAELPGMIETQFRIKSFPLIPFPTYVLRNIDLQVAEARHPPRVVHKAGLKDFSAGPVLKSSPRIHIALEKPANAPLVMRIEWRLTLSHTGSGKDKLLKVAGNWDVVDVANSLLTVTVTDLP